MTSLNKLTHDRTGREYLRVSKDRSGKQRSPDEQHAENASAAARLHLNLGDAYRETSAVSASRYSSKTRVAFDALMADLASDRFNADVLVLWESSRGSRRVGEWVTLVDVLADKNITVYVTTHGREYDPRIPRDRRSLLEDAVDSEYETAKSAMRIKRDVGRAAEEGRPHGIIPYGYTRTRDPNNGRMVKQIPEPAEVPNVLEIFTRLYSGESLRAICKDYKLRGIKTRHGKDWNESKLRQMVLSGAHAGLRVHCDDWENNRQRYPGSPGVKTTKGDWEPIITPEIFWSVYRRLTATTRKTTRPGGARHLLSLIAVCEPCGGLLTSKQRNGDWFYICQAHGCVRVNEQELDDFMTRLVVAYLSRKDNYSAFGEQEQQSQEVSKIRAELAELRVRLESLADALAEGASPGLIAKSEVKLNAKIAQLEARERDLTVPEALRVMLAPGEEVRERWEAAPISARREVMKLILVPGKAGQLRVIRNPYGRMHVPVRNRVRLAEEVN